VFQEMLTTTSTLNHVIWQRGWHPYVKKFSSDFWTPGSQASYAPADGQRADESATRGNFGDSRTFNAVIGLLLIFARILKTSSPKMGIFGGKMGKEWCDVYPERTRFYFWVFTSVPILVKIQMRAWECTQTDTWTKKNRF